MNNINSNKEDNNKNWNYFNNFLPFDQGIFRHNMSNQPLNNNIQNNFLDYISQSISNNILSSLSNNYRSNYDNLPNIRNSSKDEQKVKDNKRLENYSKEVKEKIKTKKEPNEFKETINKHQFSLQKRRENIDNFLMNYRLKNNKTNQSNNNKSKNYICFLNSIPPLNSHNLEKDEQKVSNIDKDKIISDKITEEKLYTNSSNKESKLSSNESKLKNKNIEKKQYNNNIKQDKDSINSDENNEKDTFPLENQSNQNIDNSKEELKKLFLDEIFYQKYSANNYEIPIKFFNEIKMPPYGNCFYCCISYFKYKNENNYNIIRNLVFKYISENPEKFYIFFEGNDIDYLNKIPPNILLQNYIKIHNNDGEYAGDMEYTAICKIFNLRIILLTRGYNGLNVFNVYFDNENEQQNLRDLYILFINKNHFNYLEVNAENEGDAELLKQTIFNCVQNNLLEWEKIRKKEYPLSLKWYPEIYREMYCYYKYDIIPEERFNNTKNPGVYIKRFKNLALKSFYLKNDRLYYIKECKCNRLENGDFEDVNQVVLKKIPLTYEIIPKLNELHDNNGHISSRTLAKKFIEDEFYIDNIELITKEYTNQCPECYSKYYSRKLVKQPKIIFDEGPHYRLLVDITYLDKKYYSKKTEYKYIIDCIDHFSKFYWGYLIRDKTSKTTLNKIKNFISINKKPVIIQTDNGLEFKNKLLDKYLEDEGIKHILSRPHHPQTNGCLERYHRELHKFMKNYLDSKKDFEDADIEDALDEYIRYHNNTRKSSTKYIPNDIRDLDDPDLIDLILNNILKSFKRHRIDKNEIIDNNEKLLLWNNLTLNNNIYIKNKNDIQKSGEFIYPCNFKESVNTDTVKIYFEIDIGFFEKNIDYLVDIDCLIIIPEFVYNYFLLKSKRNQQIQQFISLDNIKDNSSEISDYMDCNNLSIENDNDSEENIPKKKIIKKKGKKRK